MMAHHNSHCVVHPDYNDASTFYNKMILEGGHLKNASIPLAKPLQFPINGTYRMSFCDIYIEGDLEYWFTNVSGEFPSALHLKQIYNNMYSVCVHWGVGGKEDVWINHPTSAPAPVWAFA